MFFVATKNVRQKCKGPLIAGYVSHDGLSEVYKTEAIWSFSLHCFSTYFIEIQQCE